MVADDATATDWRADQERRIYEAAGVLPGDLSADAASVVHWLAGWDDHTVRGVEELLATARAHDDGYSKVTTEPGHGRCG